MNGQGRVKLLLPPARGDRIEAEVPDGDNTYKVVLRQNDERYFDTSCGCDEKEHPICVHKATLFMQVLRTQGAQYFQSMRDWDEQKNKLLRLYGYSLNDDLTNKFTFTYENGKPFLRVLDPTIKKVNTPVTETITMEVPVAKTVIEKEETTTVQQDEKRLGIVIDTSINRYPFVDILLVSGKTDEEGKHFIDGIERPDLLQYVNPLQYKEGDRELIPVIRKFTADEIVKYLKKNLPFGDFIDGYEDVLKEQPTEEVKEQVWEFLLPKYQKLLHRYAPYQLCFLKSSNGQLASSKLHTIEFMDKAAHPQLSVKKEKKEYVISLDWIIDNVIVPHSEVKMLNEGLLLQDYRLYTLGHIAE